ncbi:MAG: LPS export ABC transporter permease LptG [Proteobacteria bacterium]|nr:LPS export ABC transporter permease LptG [Pseudomonadota bacterium]
MSILNRYLTREFLKFFSIVQMVVLLIFVSIDYLSNLDRFIRAELPLSRGLTYVLLKMPYMTVLLTPVGTVLSVIIVFGLMNKNRELLALKSSGISILSMLKPFLAIGILLSLFLFLMAEEIVPAAMTQARYMKTVEIKKKAIITSKEKNIWIKGDRRITHIKYYQSTINTIFGITQTFFDNQFNLIRRIDAEKGEYKDKGWILHGIMEQRVNPKTDETAINFFEKREEPLDFVPEDLNSVVKKSEEMGYRELYHYVRKMESEGYDATLYRVDLYAKIAFPFVCIIMCMAGIGITAKTRIDHGLPLYISSGIGLSFLYWVFYSFCLSLGHGGMLPPLVAAWAANFVLFCFSLFILMSAE